MTVLITLGSPNWNLDCHPATPMVSSTQVNRRYTPASVTVVKSRCAGESDDHRVECSKLITPTGGYRRHDPAGTAIVTRVDCFGATLGATERKRSFEVGRPNR